MKSTSSFGSSRLDQSQKTGLSGSQSGASSNGADSADEGEQGDGATNFTRAMDDDPIIVGLEKIFDESISEVQMNGDAKVSYLKRVIGKNAQTQKLSL